MIKYGLWFLFFSKTNEHLMFQNALRNSLEFYISVLACVGNYVHILCFVLYCLVSIILFVWVKLCSVQRGKF